MLFWRKKRTRNYNTMKKPLAVFNMRVYVDKNGVERVTVNNNHIATTVKLKDVKVNIFFN